MPQISKQQVYDEIVADVWLDPDSLNRLPDWAKPSDTIAWNLATLHTLAVYSQYVLPKIEQRREEIASMIR